MATFFVLLISVFAFEFVLEFIFVEIFILFNPINFLGKSSFEVLVLKIDVFIFLFFLGLHDDDFFGRL